MSTKIDSPPVENWNTDTLISFLRRQDLKFDNDDFEILRREKITGFDFTNMTKEEFERCGLKIGPSRRLVEIAVAFKSRSKCSFSYHSLKEVLKEYKILSGTYPLKGDDKNINYVLPGTYSLKDDASTVFPLSKKSVGTQTTNVSDDPKSLTYIIQGLISGSIAYFPLDERVVFKNGTTEGICKISSGDPRLSSVSLYCEYKLGKTYIHQPPPNFSGYPIALKSPFSSIGTIITGLDHSKTKLIDNINYVIEFVEIPGFEEFVKSSRNISSSSTLTTTVATQTKPIVEDTKALTYIAKGIMFKSICWFPSWDEQEAFRFGKVKGTLRLVSTNPKLASITLTCNYQLAKSLCCFQGDIGYPMIVSCSYGSVKTLLTQDKKKIMDNSNFRLTFLS
ncbi:uncharacterized protein OCT59_017660 [Rhizophagus irregularis]|uniref:SAM domain-containing protein n=2 Tax=Rhizophagus irregularis TaxID=588596 RepID=A0A015M9Z8_RHIIW|nr:hypothetical protein GLOIN_2v1542620 [Rhizophagus irregularis DAOM 181602=DAOM 197198]EXX63633.1 hypothetical protein RirG_150560 [Rhizophagus irregularis DAOM 197198w]POG77915.1 hypothetical protein GLOIN_2v1542620 [Rhizophagus irregularis DAOM 181602=DAOM 197198]UZO25394.1 hypothetical protein OCT59_017660 [Rhizophagus irregularis]GBC46583.1 hypothetical protein GLOIN_2v1542620 [Rhizophagus irregularis DAOM 181602=DAOM 197198]|eukprot:XP_025184781.1 hypothetical protein GLOIN_2v1542620 [Rhizophagus irregularis DAOM 181602=DAOM 197198]